LITVRKSIVPDIHEVAQTMRPEDVAEVYAGSGDSPHKALVKGYLHSTECFTLVKGGKLGMFGYVKAKDEPCAAVWMLASTNLLKHKWAFLRQSREWVDYMQAQSPVLFNCVDQRNEVHISWLDWLGFRFVRTIPQYGHQKLPFIEFVRIKHV
jgi:hypothetical protein